jgi:regulatory protein
MFMPVVTMLERQKKRTDRVNVYLDGEFAFGLNELDAVQLRKGQELTEEQVTALREKDAVNLAEDAAIRFLSYRPRSTQEIRRHLADKEIPALVVEAAIERLQRAGYLDDAAFVRFWIENRTRFQPRGPMALRYELRQKGVDDRLVNELLAESVDTDATAMAAARSQLRRYRGKPRQIFRQKMGAFLQRRGFNYSTASQVIRQLTEELAESDPDFFGVSESDADE